MSRKVFILAITVNVVMIVVWYRHKTAKELQTFSGTDYNKLMDIAFQFKHLPDVCDNRTSKFIVAVHTSPDHFDQRKTIRETWASWAKHHNILVLFFVGLTENAEHKKKLQEEIAEHNDFVQGRFTDTSHNITYKHLMIFKFILYHCSNAEYVIKANDYVFVNIPNVKDFIDQYSVKHRGSNNILCKTIKDADVSRSGKYAVSEDEYLPGVYPTHCAGYFVIYTKTAATMLYLAAQQIEYFRMDDVLMSGILANPLRIQHTNIDKLILDDATKNKIVKNAKFSEEIKPFLFYPKNLNETHSKALWHYILKVTPKAKILGYLKIYP